MCVHDFFTGCAGVRSSGGGVDHDEAGSSLGAYPFCRPSENEQFLLDGSQTAAAALLHRWSGPENKIRGTHLNTVCPLLLIIRLLLCFSSVLMLVSPFSWRKLLFGRLANDFVMWRYPAEFVSWSTMERLFHQSVFETMPLTRLDQNGVLLNAAGTVGTLGQAEPRTPTTIPWDSPLSYAKQQLHNSQTKGVIHLLVNSVTVMLWHCLKYSTRYIWLEKHDCSDVSQLYMWHHSTLLSCHIICFNYRANIPHWGLC